MKKDDKMNAITFLYATAPGTDVAGTIARALVERRLAACVNVFPGMTSVYLWEGEVEAAAETALIVKTTRAAAPAARDLILTLHPHRCPAVVGFEVDEAASSAQFCDWIRAETAPTG